MHRLIAIYPGPSKRAILPAGTGIAVFIGNLVESGDTQGNPSNTTATLSNIANLFAIQQRDLRRMIFRYQFERVGNTPVDSE